MVAKNEYDAAVRALFYSYMNVLQVNLTTDSYEIIKAGDKCGDMSAPSPLFSECVMEFARAGQVYEDDLDAYLVKTDIEYLRNYFQNENESMSFRYRRKTLGGYRWTLLDIVRDSVYSLKNQKVYMYLKDIEDECADDAKQQREMEHMCKHDTLTKLQNAFAYRNFSTLFGKMTKKPSVGVLFSDLNGLKIINDVQGHKAGNEYILSYADMLRSVFPQNCLYRISGDEFLTVCVGMTKKEFAEKTRELKGWLKEQNVPIASVGEYWSKDVDDLQDAVKEAEVKMYLEKKKFYQMHPEYKREAVEASYSQEMNAIILDLAKAYPTLGIIDVKNDTYRLIKMDSGIGDKIIRPTYSEYVDYFLNELLTPESKKDMEKVSGVTKLKRALRNQESITATFQMKTGSWRQITFRVIERKEGQVSKIVFYALEMNQYMSEVLEKDMEVRTNYELMQGLCYDYTMLSWIDLSEERVNVKIINGLPEEWLKVLKSRMYEEAMGWFAAKYVEADSVAQFLRDTSLTKVVNELKQKQYYSVYTKTKATLHGNDKSTFSKFFFHRIEDGSNRVMLATKNISDMMKKSKEVLEVNNEMVDVVMDQDTIERLLKSISPKIYG